MVDYAANGTISDLKLGNNLVEQTCLNTRLQPLAIRLATSQTTNCANSGSDVVNLGFTYTATGINNNGNLQTQTIAVPGQSAITQTYTYDGVNRITKFTESSGTTANQYYCYDAFGNRYLPGYDPVCNPTSGANWISYPGQTPTSNTFPNNQWAAGSGVTYDAAGNQTGIAASGGTTTRPSCASSLQPGVAMLRVACYDAENRMTVATSAAPVTTTYVYDGEGRRVQKTVGSTTTTFVYDAQGHLAAEYGGPANPLTGTTYLTGDHLGSTRLVTDSSGSAVQRFDYAPFGEELTAGMDGRTAPYSANQYPNASPDGTSQKFTSKERDSE